MEKISVLGEDVSYIESPLELALTERLKTYGFDFPQDNTIDVINDPNLDTCLVTRGLELKDMKISYIRSIGEEVWDIFYKEAGVILDEKAEKIGLNIPIKCDTRLFINFIKGTVNDPDKTEEDFHFSFDDYHYIFINAKKGNIIYIDCDDEGSIEIFQNALRNYTGIEVKTNNLVYEFGPLKIKGGVAELYEKTKIQLSSFPLPITGGFLSLDEIKKGYGEIESEDYLNMIIDYFTFLNSNDKGRLYLKNNLRKLRETKVKLWKEYLEENPEIKNQFEQLERKLIRL